jgi:putative colanic acid biosynthesis glycosyltransferase
MSVCSTVSVVTVCLNCASEIGRTIDSVASQDHLKVEYIVVDGGSVDGTIEILKRRRSDISILLVEPDRGLYDAMNKGMRLATGDFVFFLNAGDIFAESQTLRLISQQMLQRSFVYFGRVEIRSSAGTWVTPVSDDPTCSSAGFLPHHQSVFYPRAFFSREEYDLTYQLQADIKFTTKAINSYQSAFIDITVAVSMLGGYTLKTFSSWSLTLSICDELLRIARENDSKLSRFSVWLLYSRQIIKFLTLRLFGEKILFRLMKFAAFRISNRSSK